MARVHLTRFRRPIRAVSRFGACPIVSGEPQRFGRWAALIATAQAIVMHRPQLAFIDAQDAHTLSDIGLEADAVLRELPVIRWPN